MKSADPNPFSLANRLTLTEVEAPLLGWDDTPCPLCHRHDSAVLLEAPDPSAAGLGLWFAVVKCSACGLIYTNPRPDADSIGQFYSANYRPHRRPSQLRRPLRRWYRLAGFPDSRGKERRELPLHGQGRLLDFGCGGGGFLLRMAEQGWNVMGLDASVGAVTQIREEFGLRALVGSLPHPELEPQSFDVVTMWHSLEHVHQPLSILQEAHRLLVPGGRLIVAVPNIDSWPFRWFGTAWFGLDLPRHLTHFTPVTLREMIERAGFQINVVRPIRHADWLRSSAKLARRSGPVSWFQRALRYKPVARLAAWACYLARRSDCIMALAQR